LLSRKDPTQNELQAGLTTEFNVRCRRRREVIAFDLATKLTDGDGDTAMDEDGSLAQHGFADYNLPPERYVSCRPDGYCGRPGKRLAV